MRKIAWLIAFAISALLFGAADGAFAHSASAHASSAAGHQHTMHAHGVDSAIAASGKISADQAEADRLPGEFAASFDALPALCPHGQSLSDCGSCCACSSGVSAALATAEPGFREYRADTIHIVTAAAYRLRQAVFDLSRPPKSFA